MGILDRDYMRRDYVPRSAGKTKPPLDAKRMSYWVFILVGGILILGGVMHVAHVNTGKSASKPQAEGTAPTQANATQSFVPLDINAATYEQIRTVPYMSEATAKGIIELRPFKKWDDLDAVYGIGSKRLESLRKYFFIAPPKSGGAGQQQVTTQ